MLALALFLFASQLEDARPLLQQIADSARNAKSWRAEGVVTNEYTGPGAQTKLEFQLKVAAARPNFSRMETTGGMASDLVVCDGSTAWIYRPNANQYTKSPAAGNPACGMTVLGWTTLMDGLESAVFNRRETVQFQGAATTCDVVEAEYTKLRLTSARGAIPAPGTRTLCIDRTRNLILRDRVQTAHFSSTTVYTSIEVEPQLPPDLFRFEPPAGSTPVAAHTAPASPGQSVLPPRAPVEPVPSPIYPVGGKVSAPVPIHKVEPQYTETARQAHIEGVVVLSIVIGPDGVPGNVRVVRPLGYGLDEKAIEAITQWRFRPGQKDGNPVAVPATVEMNFRNLDNPPR